ncbi:15715_t:CDS:2, partial [Racocetra persica]
NYIQNLEDKDKTCEIFVNKTMEEISKATNKEIYGVLLNKIQAAEAAINNLEIREKECQEFFTEQNIATTNFSINTNQDQLAGSIDNIEEGIVNLTENVSEIKEDIKKIAVMLKGFEDFNDALKKDIIEKPLNLHNFSRTEEERGNTRKWIRNSDNYEAAFTEMNSLLEGFYFEISMLKRLQESHDIIQFFGMVENERLSKTYLVTEWSKYDTYNILHHDVRSANIMIDSYKHAKLANCSMSRRFANASKNLKNVIDASRYKTPEKIKYSNYKYDSRYEITETDLPFSNIETHIIETEILKTPLPLTFRNDVPEKWKKLLFKEYFSNLKSLSENSDTSTNKKTPPTLASFIRSIMPIEEAIKQHSLKDEDRLKQTANLFKEAADEGDMMKAQIQYASYLCNVLALDICLTIFMLLDWTGLGHMSSPICPIYVDLYITQYPLSNTFWSNGLDWTGQMWSNVYVQYPSPTLPV